MKTIHSLKPIQDMTRKQLKRLVLTGRRAEALAEYLRRYEVPLLLK